MCRRFVYGGIYFFHCAKSPFEKQKMPKSAGSSTQPCLTQLTILKRFRHITIMLYSTPHIVMKKLNKTFQILGPILMKILNHPSLLTNAFVISMNVYSGIFYSLR